MNVFRWRTTAAMHRENAQLEKEIHRAFDITLFLKGAHAAIEVIGGVLFYFVSAESIVRFVDFLARGELLEDPHDFIANYLLATAEHFGGSAQAFAAGYLLIHGIVNGAIVVGLWRQKVWTYPIAIAALVAFIAYQMYLLSFHYSFWLAAFTVVDVAVIFLVWHEYGVLKRKGSLPHW
jgi:uncharacterized membrane protein